MQVGHAGVGNERMVDGQKLKLLEALEMGESRVGYARLAQIKAAQVREFR